MTLKAHMAAQIGAMITGLLLISGAGLWGIIAMQQDFDSAIAGYARLRQVYEIGSHVATAKTLVRLQGDDLRQSLGELRTADSVFRTLAQVPSVSSSALLPPRPAPAIRLQRLAASLADAQDLMVEAIAHGGSASPRIGESLDRILGQLPALAAEIRQSIEQVQRAADAKRHTATAIVGLLALVVIVGAVVVGVRQYRGVTRPLGALASTVRHMAQGNLQERARPVGNDEFVALAADFNRMADQLEELYRDLERKVEQKSRELIRSERLASVGYLAAGVAHEINNPIGIIAGNAEFALQQSQHQGAGGADCARTLALIAEEAFRCKQIVEKLLSLARPGDETRAQVSLGAVTTSVVEALAGIRPDTAGKIVLDIDRHADLSVVASEGEMKQVLLNLAINALEAIEGAGTRVSISISRSDDWVRLCVADDGRGMSEDVLQRVFEPFFTARRGTGRPGTGLGLSISNAIVQSHGGRIYAESGGVGKGSRFTVELPAARKL